MTSKALFDAVDRDRLREVLQPEGARWGVAAPHRQVAEAVVMEEERTYQPEQLEREIPKLVEEIGCRVLDVPPKRFCKCSLRLHPEKHGWFDSVDRTVTTLVEPARQGPRTFDLPGFLHYSCRSRKSNWIRGALGCGAGRSTTQSGKAPRRSGCARTDASRLPSSIAGWR